MRTPSRLIMSLTIVLIAGGCAGAGTATPAAVQSASAASQTPTAASPTEAPTLMPTPIAEPLNALALGICDGVFPAAAGEVGSFVLLDFFDLGLTSARMQAGEAGAAMEPFGAPFYDAAVAAPVKTNPDSGLGESEVTADLHQVATDIIAVCRAGGWVEP